MDKYLTKAIELAEEGERSGNLPIGAVLVLDGRVVASGWNTIFVPELRPHAHAEMNTMLSAAPSIWMEPARLELYTTLEPCLMCAATIFMHKIGSVVFGSVDPYGGASKAFGHMPDYYEEQLRDTTWSGPAAPKECDPLFQRALERFKQSN